jgi:ferric-dicitrate binding protein FerR (iron transport regulator)
VESNPEVQQHVETLKKLWQNNPAFQKHTPGLQSNDRQRIKRILAKAEERKEDPLGKGQLSKGACVDNEQTREGVDNKQKEGVYDQRIKEDDEVVKLGKEEGFVFKPVQEIKPLQENRSVQEDKPVQEKGKVLQLFARYIPYAAILFLVVAGSWFFLFRGRESGPVGSTSNERVVIAQKGSRTRTLLPDGTIVWLNSGSKISYAGDFKGALREVHLSGEAFFDVVKQPNRPFIVHAGDINVRVLGTAFNVKFYEGDQNIETTLLRGSIEVTSQKDKNSKILLKPNEKLVVSSHASEVQEDSSVQKETVLGKQEKDFQIIQFNTPAKEDKLLETAWIYNRLEFRDDDFQALASKLERWYNVNIVFGDEAVKEFKFNGSFEKETIEEAMTALQKVHSFTYKINANEIYVQSTE